MINGIHVYFCTSAGPCIGRMKKKFLNDEGGMVLALDLDCLKHKLGVAENILQEAKRKENDIFAIKDLCTLTNESPEGRMLGVSII